jgi:hypothetical protein
MGSLNKPRNLQLYLARIGDDCLLDNIKGGFTVAWRNEAL